MDIERRYASGPGLSTPPGPVELPGERARLEDRRQGAAAAALDRTRGQPRQARYGPATSSVSSLPDVAAASMSVALTWANGPATSARVHVCRGRLSLGSSLSPFPGSASLRARSRPGREDDRPGGRA